MAWGKLGTQGPEAYNDFKADVYSLDSLSEVALASGIPGSSP